MAVRATDPQCLNLDDAIAQLTGDSIAVMLYGSHARGDAGLTSDVDLLQLVPHSPRSYTSARVSVVAYTPAQLKEMAAQGSLFAWHLRTEGVVVHDPQGLLRESLAVHSGPAFARTLLRVADLSAIVDLGRSEFTAYANRATRTARYLARTAMYARALEAGGSSFNLDAAAISAGRPHLAQLLGRPSEAATDWGTFVAYRSALSELIGPLRRNPFKSLEALAVQSWEKDPHLASLAIQTLLPHDGEIAYSSLPPPVL